MAKRWRKQKAGQQEKKHKKRAGGAHDGGSASSAGGTLGAFRRKTQGFFGSPSKPKANVGKLFDALSWVVILVLGGIFIVRQCKS